MAKSYVGAPLGLAPPPQGNSGSATDKDGITIAKIYGVFAQCHLVNMSEIMFKR